MARLRCTGLTAKDAAICGSAVAITVPSRFSMKSAQATVSAMTADRSSLGMPMFYCPGGAIRRRLLCEQPWMSANSPMKNEAKNAASMAGVSIRIEAPDQPDVLELLAASDTYHLGLYPPESLYLLDPAALRAPGVTFYVARIDGVAVGCRAILRPPLGEGGSQRRFVRPAAARGERRAVEALARAQQLLRIGMGGDAAAQPLDVERLDDLALAHDGEAVADIGDDGEVVADQHDGQPVLGAQAVEQVEDLRLHRDVERRGRLVEQQDRRLEDEGARDGDALALPAGKLMRVAEAVLLPEPDLGEGARDALVDRVEPLDLGRLG